MVSIVFLRLFSTRKTLANVPSFREFMHKKKVKRQYREFMEAVKLLKKKGTDVTEIHEQIRSEYKAGKTNITRQYKLYEAGQTELKALQTMVSTALVDDKIIDDYTIGEGWPWEQ